MKRSILNGDFRDSRLYGSHVDFVFFDPPYGQNKNYKESADWSVSSYADLVRQSILLSYHQTKGRFAVFVSSKVFPIWLKEFEGLTDPRIIIVHKRAHGIKRNNMYDQWFAIIASCNPIVTTSNFWDDIRLPGEGYYFREKRFDHPAQTSLALTERVISNWTAPGEVVLDFFAGVGTTGVACEKLGRGYVLIEKSPTYCQVIRERLNVK